MLWSYEKSACNNGRLYALMVEPIFGTSTTCPLTRRRGDAAAAGIPPPWIRDIAATEAWALMQSAMFSEPGSRFIVDCKPCAEAFWKGPKAASHETNPHARVHGMMHASMEGIPIDSVIWMPAHLASAVGL